MKKGPPSRTALLSGDSRLAALLRFPVAALLLALAILVLLLLLLLPSPVLAALLLLFVATAFAAFLLLLAFAVGAFLFHGLHSSLLSDGCGTCRRIRPFRASGRDATRRVFGAPVYVFCPCFRYFWAARSCSPDPGKA